jgi:hypothetical protein
LLQIRISLPFEHTQLPNELHRGFIKIPSRLNNPLTNY